MGDSGDGPALRPVAALGLAKLSSPGFVSEGLR